MHDHIIACLWTFKRTKTSETNNKTIRCTFNVRDLRGCFEILFHLVRGWLNETCCFGIEFLDIHTSIYESRVEYVMHSQAEYSSFEIFQWYDRELCYISHWENDS